MSARSRFLIEGPQTPTRRRPRAIAAALLLALAGLVPTGAYAVDDAALSSKIKSELVRNLKTDHALIEVSSRDGLVTLTGAALSSHQRRLASEIALRFPGVMAVENRLVVNAR